jgi:hypothetical protein
MDGYGIIAGALACAFTLAAGTSAYGENVREWNYVGTVEERRIGGSSQPCGPGACGGFDAILPMGSVITMDIAFDHDVAEDSGCVGYYPGAVSSLGFTIAGQPFTTNAYTWVGAYGFSGGCGPSNVCLELVTPGPYVGTPLPGSSGPPLGAYATGGFAGLWGSSVGWRTALPQVLAFGGPEIWLTDAQGSQRLTFSSTLQRSDADVAPVPTPAAGVLLGLAAGVSLLRRRPRR